jgi:hypothetical protein
MRVALAIAATVALPTTALADEPVPGIPGPGVPVPASEPAPAPAPEAPPVEPGPAPKSDPAYGDVRNFPAPKGKDVVVVGYPERSKQNIVLLGSLAAGGVVMGAIGLYFNLDASSASDEVSANKATGEPWSADKQEVYERAHRSTVTAGIFYGIGGGLLLATAVAYIVTEPKAETTVIHPHATALVAPTKGGAIVGGAWRF